jgi:signal transduction histidine kinase
MKRDHQVKTNALPVVVARQVEENRTELANRYHRTLREALFTNHADVRPAMLERIASDEVDALLNYLLRARSTGGERGAQLCQLGLSLQAVLHLGQDTRRFFLTHLENDLVPRALDTVGVYQNAVIQGFVQSLEDIILSEQEHIRGALQIAVSRYTIEIKETQALAEEAIKASQFKSRFMARVSHELRTPLGALMGMSEMLKADVYGPLTPAQQDIVQRIINNAKALEQFFAEILDQSFVESGELRLKEEKFSPQELTKAVHSTCLPLALQKGLSLHTQVDPDLPSTMIGDRARIEQILSNLVVNAIKFTETGGITIHVYQDGDRHWALQVKDTGIGISEENLTHIFQPFRQIDETTTRKANGVGLGLAIVQQLTTMMNGTVTVRSKVGQGSTFTVILPLQTTG